MNTGTNIVLTDNGQILCGLRRSSLTGDPCPTWNLKRTVINKERNDHICSRVWSIRINLLFYFFMPLISDCKADTTYD